MIFLPLSAIKDASAAASSSHAKGEAFAPAIHVSVP
jgi:hypothetical protein